MQSSKEILLQDQVNELKEKLNNLEKKPQLEYTLSKTMKRALL